VKIEIGTLVVGPDIRTRAMVVQQKTGKPVQFELMADARASLLAWLERRGGTVENSRLPVVEQCLQVRALRVPMPFPCRLVAGVFRVSSTIALVLLGTSGTRSLVASLLPALVGRPAAG
jgi:hypothetical protein